jgi:hydroxymethylglutaryl-CoA reductase
MKKRTSQLPGFYKVTVVERRNLVSEATGVDANVITRSLDAGGLEGGTVGGAVERMIVTHVLGDCRDEKGADSCNDEGEAVVVGGALV